jgi:type II pantothenate kinase
MVKVDGESKFQRVSGAVMSHRVLRRARKVQLYNPGTICDAGTNIGGGTFWGLCKLLTGLEDFDDILSLSCEGDNSNVRLSGTFPAPRAE